MIIFKKIAYIFTILLVTSSLSFATFDRSSSFEEQTFTQLVKSSAQIIEEIEKHIVSLHSLKISESETDLPTRVDLSMFADIFDQGSLGSCTSHCVIQSLRVLETIDLIQNNPWLTIKEAKAKIPGRSRLYHYYYARQYQSTSEQDLTQEDSGASLSNAIWVLGQKILPYEKDWPYDIKKFKQKPPSSLEFQTRENIIKSNFYSKELPIGNLKSLKKALSKNCPVLVSLALDPYFQFSTTAKDGYFKIPKKQNLDDLEGHAITLLGYDDKDYTNGYEYEGHFIAANSWGKKWGLKLHRQRGFFKIPYTVFKSGEMILEIWKFSS